MAAITHLSDPLSDEELERLQTILLDRVDEDAVTDGKDEGALDVSELDGLLTAVVSGPVTIVPSRWLPAVWGDFEPTWHSADDFGACEGYMRGVGLAGDEWRAGLLNACILAAQ